MKLITSFQQYNDIEIYTFKQKNTDAFLFSSEVNLLIYIKLDLTKTEKVIGLIYLFAKLLLIFILLSKNKRMKNLEPNKKVEKK